MMKLRMYSIISQRKYQLNLTHLLVRGLKYILIQLYIDEDEERGAGLLEVHMDEPENYGYAEDE